MKLYNTMSRTIEDFIPYSPDEVTMYTCGPTVYNYAHIGNLRTYISEDVFEKALIFLGYNVKRCMNVTDVGHLESDADDGEDKMLKGAKRENKTVWEVAAFYTEAFFKDCAELNIKKPQIIVNATAYIEEYIEFIKTLEEKGYTYLAGGNVYFDISKFERYTELSKLDLDSLKTASREGVTVDQNKKNPQDFVLWFTKSKFNDQAMKWDSPWGVGYPGWHIECSVIALKNLGEHLDIHCGGVDHIPVHHTNEIAQTESYTGKKWTKYWWHADFLIDNIGKMSKSKGEFLTLEVLKKYGYHPLDYRYYTLGSHYRKQLPFNYSNLDMAQQAYQKLKRRIKILLSSASIGKITTARGKTLIDAFSAALQDDLNTANALTVLYEVLKSDIESSEKLALIQMMDTVLSLDLLVVETYSNDIAEVQWIEDMIAKRVKAKAEKNWSSADAIRDQLAEKGIAIVDTKEGTTWSYKN